MNQILGIIAGVMGGIVWEKILTSPYKNIPTITPSWILRMSGHALHFHHWIGYLFVLLIVTLIAYKTNCFAHPSVLMIASFFISATLYDFYKFPDWYKFISN